MRPIKMTMTAFGPYKYKEVIDFTELKNYRLFVVSGNTGAGKTTIFDAICFALYGTASGEDRSDSKYLRSDFADDDVHTSVELEFELHDRHYRIRRQLPHVKKGNKNATGDHYEFFEKINGKDVPCVDRQIVSEINKKVEELVGLTKDQFSQIVMLPQGEFRKLLTSQTENKEEILRKIFRTERYNWFSQRLKEKKKLAEDQFNREKLTRDRYINDIHATIPKRENSKIFEVLAQEHFNTNQVVIGLEEETIFYQEEIVKNKNQAEIKEAAYNVKLEEFHKAEELNKRFHTLEEKENDFHKLNDQVPLYKEKEIQLEKADRANKMEAYEKQLMEWRLDEKEKQQKLAEAEGKEKAAVEQLKKAKKEYLIEESKKDEREDNVRALDRYNELLPTVREIDSKNADLIKKELEVQKLENELEVLQSKIKEEKLSKDQLSQHIKKIEKEVDQLTEKQQKLPEMRDQVRVLHEYLGLNKKQTDFETKFKGKEDAYQQIKKQYDLMEEAWMNGQATILAVHLHDGKPCPVCGSIEHPNKAQVHNTVPTKEEREAVKKELDSKDNEYRDIVAKLNTNREQLEAKTAEVAQMGIDIQDAQHSYDQLAEEGQALKKEVDFLINEKVKLDGLRNDLEKKEKELEKYEWSQKQQTKVYQEQYTFFETQKAVFQEQISHIPEDMRNLSALEQKIVETIAIKMKLEQAWEKAQKQLQLSKEGLTAATANLINANNQLEESRIKKEKSELQFMDILHQAQFETEEMYRQAKMSERDRQQLKEEIEKFNQNLAALKEMIKELQEALKGKMKVDLAAIKSQLDELKNAFDFAQETFRKSEQYLQKVMELKVKLLEAEESVSHLEKQLNIITDLHDMIRGQNDRKISFERYLQIEFLEQIIIAANERLKKISNGQFLLIRSERQESRGRQSGLGLDVYDAFTGQNRDVKTLSGGEKFNASLCLALGMADVIQSFQGGVSIDTMFIDEGFGSLDEESLNKAIDTLIDLQQSGRMIGVISHVQELKNAIPAILEVSKTKEGYSHTKFVIK